MFGKEPKLPAEDPALNQKTIRLERDAQSAFHPLWIRDKIRRRWQRITQNPKGDFNTITEKLNDHHIALAPVCITEYQQPTGITAFLKRRKICQEEDHAMLPPNYEPVRRVSPEPEEGVLVWNADSEKILLELGFDPENLFITEEEREVVEVIRQKLYYITGIDVRAFVSAHANRTIPIKIDPKKCLYPGGVQDFYNDLKDPTRFGIDRNWRSIAGIIGITEPPEELTIGIQNPDASSVLVRTQFSFYVDSDGCARFHSIRDGKLNYMELSFFTQIDKGSMDTTLQHEFVHNAIENAPENLQEGLAELLVAINARNKLYLWESFGSGYKILKKPENAGFLIDGKNTAELDVFHGAEGWIKAVDLWDALDKDMTKLRILLDTSNQKKQKQSWESWLRDLSHVGPTELSNFCKNLEKKPGFQPAKDGQYVLLNTNPHGHVICSAFDLTLNPNHGYLVNENGQKGTMNRYSEDIYRNIAMLYDEGFKPDKNVGSAERMPIKIEYTIGSFSSKMEVAGTGYVEPYNILCAAYESDLDLQKILGQSVSIKIEVANADIQEEIKDAFIFDEDDLIAVLYRIGHAVESEFYDYIMKYVDPQKLNQHHLLRLFD